jgi:3-isopropylmalate/(R)-2-methylmalate dehydratase large subunit
MGAVAGLFGVDDTAISWLKARGADTSDAGLARPDTSENAAIRIDLGSITPRVAEPSRPDRVSPLSDLAPVQVDQVFIGSCAGGRLEDIHKAVTVLRRHGGIHAGVRLLVGPASREVAQAAQATGLLDALIDMGAVVLPTGCGACMGRLGALAPGEVAVSTQNRNFVGRVGSPEARIYLASPETAALCAATGQLSPETP